MALIETVWTKGDFIPRSGLIAWHAADTAANGMEIDDASGNGRHLNTGPFTTPPDFVLDVINGLPALEFDGVNHDPLKWASVIPNVRNAFVVAAHSDAAFPAGGAGNGGLLTGVTAGNILVGNVSSTRFFDFNFDSFGPYSYSRRDVKFPETDMQAAFNNNISIFEVAIGGGGGIALDGIQVGRQVDVVDRIWKGYWCEQIIYSRVLEATERQQVYEYLAMKYRLWRQVSSGLDVWPFQPQWQRSLTNDKLVLRSGAVSGAVKARSKSAAKKGFEASFENRRAEEYDAARAFWDLKYPGTPFIYRDDAFTPARDAEVLFTSSLPQQAGSYHDINYGFQCLEV